MKEIILENGEKIVLKFGMEREKLHLKMEIYMKDIEKIIKEVERED